MMDFIGEYPFEEALIFDSHAHYDDERFIEMGEDVFLQLKSSGVAGIITCGCSPKSNFTASKLAKENDFVFYAAGLHPGNVDSLEAHSLTDILQDIRQHCDNNKCVGIGEIGLDYYWTQNNIPLQKEVFTEQLKLSKELDKPVIVHDRDAHADTLEFLKEYKPKGVVHSFSGSVEMSEEIFKLGIYIGISGVITFKNARKLPEVVANMPLDKFLLETDAPYLTPVPYRSKLNHSAMIFWSAQKIAEIRGMQTLDVLRYALENTKKLYEI